jgi:hypothetical protein
VCAGNGHTHAHPAIPGHAQHLSGNDVWFTDDARQPSRITHHHIVAMRFDAWGTRASH